VLGDANSLRDQSFSLGVATVITVLAMIIIMTANKKTVVVVVVVVLVVVVARGQWPMRTQRTVRLYSELDINCKGLVQSSAVYSYC
jgi:hypothetical protein